MSPPLKKIYIILKFTHTKLDNHWETLDPDKKWQISNLRFGTLDYRFIIQNCVFFYLIYSCNVDSFVSYRVMHWCNKWKVSVRQFVSCYKHWWHSYTKSKNRASIVPLMIKALWNYLKRFVIIFFIFSNLKIMVLAGINKIWRITVELLLGPNGC